jgi:hypothetical protein
LLLAGILLLVWLVVQQARRNLAAMPLYRSSTPLTEPPFHAEKESDLRKRQALARNDFDRTAEALAHSEGERAVGARVGLAFGSDHCSCGNTGCERVGTAG